MKVITVVSVAALGLALLSTGALAQIVPPAPDVEMPQAYYDRMAADPSAFQFQRAWLQKYERVKQARREIEQLTTQGMSAVSLPQGLQERAVMAGTIRVPVIMIEYSNKPAPYPTTTLRGKLFTNPAGTMTALYTEMSYGNITLTGDVWGWVTASNVDTYFEGGCNGLCASAKTGQLILEALNGVDATVNFGQYDNDGPDGLPNSGDDDGFVDFVAIVHPENGGECGTANLWSHRWVVTGWPEFAQPWQSNDARSGGGFIRVFDYTIQPALGQTTGCLTTGPNEIGVFAHEFGHAFGLPDLYDTNGGGQGIGEHGLMGSGNWQLPPNPVHMSPWAKAELGWVTPTVVGPTAQLYSIEDAERQPAAYQLNIMEEKFSRKNADPLSGAWSLHCGLTTAAASARNWPGKRGYGNNWDESVRREFAYNGSNPVTLKYDVAYDTEAGYDYAQVWIDVNGTRSRMRAYDGVATINGVTIDLTPYLIGKGATSYEISFRFVSDGGWSDEDGDYNCATAAMRVDNVSVTGGGENYSSDFEQREDGWHYDFLKNPNREYFLVENRNKTTGAFDQFLNAEGLLIWHIEENVGNNTSGSTTTANLRPALVALEEADGMRHLLTGANRGDAGDSYPGSTGKTLFDNTTTPNSKSYNDFTTNVAVSGISAAAPTMTATMRAGRVAPVLTAVDPVSAESGQTVPLTAVNGAFIAYGSSCVLRGGGSDYPAQSTIWVGSDRLEGVMDLTGVPVGTYDVVVIGPDGQEAALPGAFEVTNPTPVFIQAFSATPQSGVVRLDWELFADEPIMGFNILRQDPPGQAERPVNAGGLLTPDARSYRDEAVEAGREYAYALVIVLPDGGELRSPQVSVRVGAVPLALYQNFPNPFNPSTRIQFSLPKAAPVTLTVYDISGKPVRTLVSGERPQGLSEVLWDGRSDSGDNVASGVYLYKLMAGKAVLTRKLLLLK